jgi:uncharacterized Zn finger protein
MGDEFRACPQCGLCLFQTIVNADKKIYQCEDCGCVYAILKLGTKAKGEYLNERLKGK